MAIRISVVINTLNEEKNISSVIKSVLNFFDEIIVVDMYSDDDTAKIAKELGAKVYLHKRMGYVEPARNFGIEKASGDWVFMLDADERVSGILCRKLRRLAETDRFSYVAVPRKNLVFDKWLKHSRWWPDYNVRFFKKGSVVWENEIHSVPVTKGVGFDLPALSKYAIIHNHYDSIEQFVIRMNRYTSIQAKNRISEGYEFDWADLLSKPTGEFVSRYFFGYGYRDGLHGLAVSLLQSFSELVLYLKIWQIMGFEKKDIDPEHLTQNVSKSRREVNYWINNSKVLESGNLVARFKRKLKIL